MKTKTFIKRIGAYLIDYFIITLISMAIINISFINPKHEEYQELSEEYKSILDDYYSADISAIELSEKVSDISYDLNKAGYIYMISDIVIAFLYFGVFAYVTKGQTLGKKILNLRIVHHKEGKEVKLYAYFLRVLILYSIIPNILILIGLCFNKGTYMNFATIGGNLDTILLLIIIITMIGTKEGRGLQDFIAGTKVIDLKEINDSIPEAKIKEKKEELQETSEINDEIIKPKKRKKKKNQDDL